VVDRSEKPRLKFNLFLSDLAAESLGLGHAKPRFGELDQLPGLLLADRLARHAQPVFVGAHIKPQQARVVNALSEPRHFSEGFRRQLVAQKAAAEEAPEEFFDMVLLVLFRPGWRYRRLLRNCLDADQGAATNLF